MADQDLTADLVERMRHAAAARTPLRIVGGDTKRFYGRAVEAEPFELAGHAGVLNYDPAELVVTARAGTRLAEVEALLHRHGQRLPFEPPSFGVEATIGGAVATGLAGPARVARGPVRDCVLGARLLTGDGRVLRFGGEVMKNVAGYDVARMLAGSLGVLGVLLDVSLKLLPRPVATRTLRLELEASAAIDRLTGAARRGVPVTGSFWHAGTLHVRLEGSPAALDEVAPTFGGETLDDGAALEFWADVREQRRPCFATPQEVLWRLHVPTVAPTAPFVSQPSFAFEWNGGQRWLSGLEPGVAHELAQRCGGHAARFRGARPGDEVFAPLPAPMLALHQRVRQVFDPAGILNPGRLYAAF